MRKLTSVFAIMMVCIIAVLALVACTPSITGIEVKKGTLEDGVLQYGTYDTSTAVLLVYFSDGTEVEVEGSEITFNNSIDTYTAGVQNLSISYGGYTIEYPITVTAVALPGETVSSITLTEGTVASKIEVGGTLDLSGAEIKAIMDDGTEKDVSNSDVTFGTIDTSVAGTVTLLISYEDAVYRHTVEVVDSAEGLYDVATLEVKSGTLTNVVDYHGALDTIGLVLVATYGNGIIEYVTEGYTMSTLDTTVLGETSVTFTYDDVTVDHTVTVSADADQQAKIATSIVLTTSPSSKVNRLSTLDLSGVVAEVTFMNGLSTSYTYSDLSFSDFDNTTVGAQTLTVSFTDTYGNVVTVGHTVTVLALSSETAETLTVTAGTLANKVVQNGTLSTTNALFTVEFADGSTTTVTDIAVSLDTTTTGSVTAVLSYTDIYGNEVTLDWSVTVVDDTVDLTATESLSLKSGSIASLAEYQEQFDTSTIIVIATLVDGTTVTLTESQLALSTVVTDTLGTTTLDITYDGITIQHSIEVEIDTADKALYAVSIELTTSPTAKLTRLDTLDLSSVVAEVTYMSGLSTTYTYSDLTFSEFDNSVVGAQTLTISFTDTFGNVVSVDHIVTVSARDSETPDELTVTAGTLATTVNQNGTLDLTTASFTIEFADGSTATPTADQLSVTLSTATTGSATATITFTNDYGTATLSWAVTVVDTSVDLTDVDTLSVKSGTLATSINYNGTLDTSSLVLVVTYKSGLVAEVAMSAAVTVVVNNNKDYTNGTSATITYDGASCEHALTVNTTSDQRSSIAVSLSVTGLASKVAVDGNMDTSSMVVTVTYLSGTTATLASGSYSMGTVNTSTAAEGKTVDISYTDTYGNIVTYTHTYDVVEASTLVEVNNIESNVLTNYTSADKNGFLVTDEPLYVGDDNEFHFDAYATSVDSSGNDTDYTLDKVAVTITVELVSGNNYITLTGTDLELYVLVDTTSAIFNFTEQAIGSSFRITVAATNPSADATASKTQIQATVEVVDGYNAYDALDLSVFDNGGNNGWTEFKEGTEVEGVDANAIILMSDISITDEDIPRYWFWTQEEFDADSRFAVAQEKTTYDIVGSLKDLGSTGIYSRYVDNGDEFTFYGNYFAVDIVNLSAMVLESDYETVASETTCLGAHTSLFFNAFVSGIELTEETTVDFVNINFIGNGTNDGNTWSSGGVTMVKTHYVDFTAYNNVTKDFCMAYYFVAGSWEPSTDEGKELYDHYVIDTTYVADCFQNFVYSWGGGNVLIKNSIMDNSGAPGIFTDEVAYDEDDTGRQTNRVVCVDIVDSTITTKLAGTEPWFEAWGMTTIAAQLKSLGAVLAYDQYYGTAAADIPTIISSTAVDGTTYVNAICVQKMATSVAGLFSQADIGGYTRIFETEADYNAYYGIGCTADTSVVQGLENDSEAAQYAYNYSSYALQGNASSNYFYITAMENNTIEGQATGAFSQGEYLNLYIPQGGLVVKLYD